MSFAKYKSCDSLKITLKILSIVDDQNVSEYLNIAICYCRS